VLVARYRGHRRDTSTYRGYIPLYVRKWCPSSMEQAMSRDTSNSDYRPQKGRRPGAAMSVGILLAAMVVAGTACADAMRPILVYFELPRNERHALERVACHPFNVGMRGK
jgi:hypothetical protein